MKDIELYRDIARKTLWLSQHYNRPICDIIEEFYPKIKLNKNAQMVIFYYIQELLAGFCTVGWHD